MFCQNIFSERLRSLRKANNLTLEQLAQKFNSSKGTFANLENRKKNPSLDMIISLANYFNVSIDYLTGRTDCPDIVTRDKNGNFIVVEAMRPNADK